MTDQGLLQLGPNELRQLNESFPERYPFLLQSTVQYGDLGRYDILFAFPGTSLVLEQVGCLGGSQETNDSRFLTALDRWWTREKTPPSDSSMPFHGGWFLYLGYELGAEIEPSLQLHADPLLPTAFAVRCPAAIVFDHHERTCSLVRERGFELDQQQLADDIAHLKIKQCATLATTATVEEEPGDQFLAAVDTARDYIAAGDIYQANLSRAWRSSVPGDLSAAAIYRSLCRANPGAFAGIVHWKDVAIISSSPERLVTARGGVMSTRPIAGTRPRGSDDVVDDELLAELVAHPKERAEHVMLIDLERNDLGRVCEPGSVRVDEMMALESYAHVHHIVSNVSGTLKPEVTPGEAIAAVFPGGTITGCPKVRCMQIIDELEQEPRGAYTGSFGYLNRDGSMDLNILIRTMIKRGNEVSFRAGAGIVADSEAYAELAETRAKAKGLLRAFL